MGHAILPPVFRGASAHLALVAAVVDVGALQVRVEIGQQILVLQR